MVTQSVHSSTRSSLHGLSLAHHNHEYRHSHDQLHTPIPRTRTSTPHCTPVGYKCVSDIYFLSQPHPCLHDLVGHRLATVIKCGTKQMTEPYSGCVSVKEISKDTPFDGVESQLENPLVGQRGAVVNVPSQEHYSKLFGPQGSSPPHPRTSSMYQSISCLCTVCVMCPMCQFQPGEAKLTLCRPYTSPSHTFGLLVQRVRKRNLAFFIFLFTCILLIMTKEYFVK